MFDRDFSDAMRLMQRVESHELWQQIGELAIAGYTVLRDVLSDDETTEMRSAASELLSSASAVAEPSGRRVWNLLRRDPRFTRVLADDDINILLDYLLGASRLLSSVHLNEVGPSAPPQSMHTDVPFMPSPLPSTALLANTIWCLDPWTAGRGATQVVPGSHLTCNATPPEAAGRSAVAVECPAGSVIVMHGNLWHRSGIHDQDDAPGRIGVLALHCRGFVRAQESYTDGAGVVGYAEPALARLLGMNAPYPFGEQGPDERFVTAVKAATSRF